MAAADLSNPVLPDFDIIVNQQALAEKARFYVAGIVVDDSLAWPSMFAVQFVSSFDLEDVHE